MKPVHDMPFWLAAIEDLRRFRKGQISVHELTQKYPDFDIREWSCGYTQITQAVRIIIPEDCPLPVIPQIIRAAHKEDSDVGRIECDIRIAYQPVWDTLPKWIRIQQICEEKVPVVFSISQYGPNWRSNKEPVIDIRYCVHEGSHGDEDGYGVEDDTWIVGLLNMDGTWFKEWHIEE